MWIVTNKDGSKWLYERKPERSTKEWFAEGMATQISGSCFPFNELPSFIEQQQWKDAPIQVKFEIKKK